MESGPRADAGGRQAGSRGRAGGRGGAARAPSHTGVPGGRGLRQEVPRGDRRALRVVQRPGSTGRPRGIRSGHSGPGGLPTTRRKHPVAPAPASSPTPWGPRGSCLPCTQSPVGPACSWGPPPVDAATRCLLGSGQGVRRGGRAAGQYPGPGDLGETLGSHPHPNLEREGTAPSCCPRELGRVLSGGTWVRVQHSCCPHPGS